MLTRPARLLGAASRSVARGLRLLACQLLVELGVAAPPDSESRGLVPRSVAARRVTNVNTTSELVAAVKDESVGTIVVAAGTYNLTSAMSGAACGQDHGPSALCIGRNLTIRAETNGTVVLDAMKQDRRVVYVAGGGRAELIGLNITGGYLDGDDVGACCLNLPGTFIQRPAGSYMFPLQSGLLHVSFAGRWAPRLLWWPGKLARVQHLRQHCTLCTACILNIPGSFFQRPAGILNMFLPCAQAVGARF